MSRDLSRLTKAQLNELLPTPHTATALRKVKKAQLVAQVTTVQTETEAVVEVAAVAAAISAPSDDQIRVRALARWEAGSADTIANWFDARRDATIAQRAFEIWRKDGGEAIENWLRAERDVGSPVVAP